MKTIFLSLLFLGFGVISDGQKDTSLVNRVNEMLKLTQLKDIERIMDYTYPKLFTIVPKETMINTLKNAYDTELFIIELDSIQIDTIFPVFTIKDTSYAKVRHTMLMKMKFKEAFDSTAKESKEIMVSLMETKYGQGHVRFDPGANSLNIFIIPEMAAIKEKSAKWTFVNLNTGNPEILNMLLSNQVLEKLKEFK